MQRSLDTALDAVALLISKATFIGLRLVMMYLCAPRMERSDFGLLALAFTVAEICRFIGDWGSDTLSLRRFSHPELDHAGSQFRWVMKLRLASSLVAFGLALAGIHFLVGMTSTATTLLVAITAVTSLWLNLGVNWLQARGSLRPVSLYLSLLGIASLSIQWIANINNWSAEQQLIALLAFEIAMALLVNSLAWRHVAILAGKRERQDLCTWIADATPIAIAALLALAYSRFDQFYIKLYSSDIVLGDYSLANRLVEPFLFVAAALASTIYARASAVVLAHGAKSETTTVAALRWIKFSAGYSLTVLAVVGWGSQLFLHHIFPSYEDARLFVWIALLTLIFRCLNLCLTSFIQALGAYRRILWINLANFVSIAILVFAGGSMFGAFGAALGVTCGELLNSAIQARTLIGLFDREHVV